MTSSIFQHPAREPLCFNLPTSADPAWLPHDRPPQYLQMLGRQPQPCGATKTAERGSRPCTRARFGSFCGSTLQPGVSLTHLSTFRIVMTLLHVENPAMASNVPSVHDRGQGCSRCLTLETGHYEVMVLRFQSLEAPRIGSRALRPRGGSIPRRACSRPSRFLPSA